MRGRSDACNREYSMLVLSRMKSEAVYDSCFCPPVVAARRRRLCCRASKSILQIYSVPALVPHTRYTELALSNRIVLSTEAISLGGDDAVGDACDTAAGDARDGDGEAIDRSLLGRVFRVLSNSSTARIFARTAVSTCNRLVIVRMWVERVSKMKAGSTEMPLFGLQEMVHTRTERSMDPEARACRAGRYEEEQSSP